MKRIVVEERDLFGVGPPCESQRVGESRVAPADMREVLLVAVLAVVD